jgi:glycosyltransferase involved in cell wall biosynthesis
MKISVCLASYNGEKFIGDQIESIVRQLGERDELIISDDSSSDNTLSIIHNFQDPRIHIFTNKSYNPIFNFENAIRNSTGEVIVLSDQDDIWIENKLAIIREHFKNNLSKIHTVVLDGYVIDELGTISRESIFKWLASGKGIIKNIRKNTYMGCCMAFSRGLIEIAFPFPKRISMHDVWLGLLSEIFGTVEFIPLKTIKYRIHETNRSLQDFTLSQRIVWRCFLIVYLFKRWLLY